MEIHSPLCGPVIPPCVVPAWGLLRFACGIALSACVVISMMVMSSKALMTLVRVTPDTICLEFFLSDCNVLMSGKKTHSQNCWTFWLVKWVGPKSVSHCRRVSHTKTSFSHGWLEQASAFLHSFFVQTLRMQRNRGILDQEINILCFLSFCQIRTRIFHLSKRQTHYSKRAFCLHPSTHLCTHSNTWGKTLGIYTFWSLVASKHRNCYDWRNNIWCYLAENI